MSNSYNPIPGASTPPTQPPKGAARRTPKNRWLLSGVVGLVCGLVLGGCTGALTAGGSNGATAAVRPDAATTATATATATKTVTAPAEPAPTKTVTKTVTAKPKPPAKPKVPTVGEGVWLVGQDIPAGRYHTAGPTDGALPMCYWSRNRDASATLIIANGILKGPGYVNLAKGEYFETTGCQDWAKK